jgi:uncharacterized protein (TIGR03790 family)
LKPRLRGPLFFSGIACFAALAAFCFDKKPQAAPPAAMPMAAVPAVSPSRVLVVLNAADPGSRAVAEYYVQKRHIPEANVIRVVAPLGDEWNTSGFRSVLEDVVRRRAGADPAIDYVVLARGIPFRISDMQRSGGFSIDSVLATCLMNPRPPAHAPNPYFGQSGRFTRARFGGLLLVTRLDGPTVEDAKRLVDSSVGAKAVMGPFFLRDSFIMPMKDARDALVSRGFRVEWIEGYNNSKYPAYQGSGGPFMGHWGAGPHDTQFSADEYAAMRFLPGAICDLTWSVSAAGLRDIKSQANIAVMLRNGAAGAQGYVSEPFSDTVSLPGIVLDRYTRGYNLAESFAMGERYVNWKQIVVGDPLCAPYAAKVPNPRPLP